MIRHTIIPFIYFIPVDIDLKGKNYEEEKFVESSRIINKTRLIFIV